MPSRLFVIDSSPAVQRLVEQASSRNGYEVVGFKDGKSALEAAPRLRPELIVADYHLESLAFPELCEGLRGYDPSSHTPIIALLSASDRPDEKHLQGLGVKAFLKKPLQPEDLVEAIKKVGELSGPAGAESSKPTVQIRADVGLDEKPPEAPPSSERLTTRVMEPPSVKAKGEAAVPSPDTKSGPSHEDPLQALVSRLLDATAKRVEQTLSGKLHSVVAQEVRSQITQALAEERGKPQSETMPSEKITAMIQEEAHRKIPDLVTQHLAGMELTLQQNLTNTVTTLVGDLTEKFAQDSPEDALRKHLPALLPDIVKEPGGAMAQLVKETVEEAVPRYLRPAAEEMLRKVGRDVAQEVISSMAKEIMASIAEAEIKKEIERLTSSA